jgi:hypothetical protein
MIDISCHLPGGELTSRLPLRVKINLVPSRIIFYSACSLEGFLPVGFSEDNQREIPSKSSRGGKFSYRQNGIGINYHSPGSSSVFPMASVHPFAGFILVFLCALCVAAPLREDHRKGSRGDAEYAKKRGGHPPIFWTAC